MVAYQPCSPTSFFAIGSRLWSGGYRVIARETESNKRRFKEYFGCSPFLCSVIWSMLAGYWLIGGAPEPSHLLWALLFLKQYSTEAINGALAKCDEKTYRKWVWEMISFIAELDVVSVSCCVLFFLLIVVVVRLDQCF